jgi:hypothetical protein
VFAETPLPLLQALSLPLCPLLPFVGGPSEV